MADSGLTRTQNQAVEPTARAVAKTRHSRGLTMPVIRGRWDVRSISASMSRSMYMLKAAAPPAER